MRFPAQAKAGQDSDFKLQVAGDVVQKLRATFNSDRTKSYEFRRTQLENLLRFLDDNTDAFCEALLKDLHKPKHETLLTEVEIVKNEIRGTLHSLKDWMAPQPVDKTMATMTDRAFIQHEPYGVVLIIGAWNYPIQLALSPMVGAIAAGNCVILKPSEVAENTERLLEQLLPKYLDKDCFEVVCGGAEETGLLLKQKFDHIFYTGSSTVGKIVYEAAAKNLTPVTLELGGKSPVFVGDDADLAFTARRLMWGKTANAGQTCIAPDYVLCSPKVQEKLAEAMKIAIHDVGLSNSRTSNDYCHIVNKRQFDRLNGLLKHQTVAFGGQTDPETNFIAPTVLTNVDPASLLMKEEIFGPIMPIVPIGNVEQGIQFVKDREKPLSLYVFSKNKEFIQKILDSTSSGGVTVNDVMMHCAVEGLPFGGVGASGLGAYHGFFSFTTFSHKRAVLWRPHGMDFLMSIRYPPYSDKNTNLAKILLKFRPPLLPSWLRTAVLIGMSAVAGYAARCLDDSYTRSLLRFELENNN